MNDELILAIDNGTQSVRALLFDPQGNLYGKEREAIEPYYSTAPGLAEQDPEVFWNACCLACQRLFKTHSEAKSRLKAVSVTTQRATVINLDSAGNPLRAAISWLDQRRSENLPNLSFKWHTLFTLLGLSGTINYLRAEAEANWIRFHQPEVWEKTHKFVYLSGFLTHRLCGRYADSIGCQVGYMPFDYKKHAWAKPSDWSWEALGIEPEKLVELVPVGEAIGEISTSAAEQTGIPQGIPLIAAAADKACEVLGSGCISPQIGCISYGTTATINTVHHEYREAIPLLPPYPAAIPGSYTLELQIFRGYWMVSWFKQEFGLREIKIAEEKGVAPETLFDELVEAVPPGSQGLILQPYWSPGLKHPGPEARGAIIGFGDVHTRAHIYRAILEGLAYALREAGEKMASRTKIPIKELRVAGGGSQSNAAMQLTADIFGLPVSRPHIYEASGLGAAIDAAVGVGLHDSFESAVPQMTRKGDEFDPQSSRHELYNELYSQVYRKMYHRLKPLYSAIRQIVGSASFYGN